MLLGASEPDSVQRHRRGALEHGLCRSRSSFAAVHPRPAPSRVPARKRCTPLQALAAARRHSRGRITWLVLCPLLTAVRPRRSTEADCGRQARHEPRHCHRSPFGWGPTGRVSPGRLGQRRGVMLYRNHPHGQKKRSSALGRPRATYRGTQVTEPPHYLASTSAQAAALCFLGICTGPWLAAVWSLLWAPLRSHLGGRARCPGERHLV